MKTSFCGTVSNIHIDGLSRRATFPSRASNQLGNMRLEKHFNSIQQLETQGRFESCYTVPCMIEVK